MTTPIGWCNEAEDLSYWSTFFAYSWHFRLKAHDTAIHETSDEIRDNGRAQLESRKNERTFFSLALVTCSLKRWKLNSLNFE